VEYFPGFYDVHADCFSGLFAKRKRVVELEAAFRRLRRCYPGRRLYVVLDNLPQVHDHPRFLALAQRLRIHLVYTPTEASWLNLIEPQFGVTKRSTLTDTDDRSHPERRRRIVRYIRWRNRHAGTHQHRLSQLLTIRDIKLDRH